MRVSLPRFLIIILGRPGPCGGARNNHSRTDHLSFTHLHPRQTPPPPRKYPPPPPPLEWISSPSLVATVLIAPQDAESPGSGRMGVIGALVYFPPSEDV